MGKIFPIKLVISMLLALTLLGTAPALAASDIWSFADNPHPDLDDRTDEEKSRLEKIYRTDPKERPCETILAAQYDLYKRRYPQFGNTGTPDENFANWKIHVSQRPFAGLNGCLSLVPATELRDANLAPSDFYFCGRYSRPPATAEQRQYARWIDELVVYAQSASEPSVYVLLSVNKNTSVVDLAPPVEYYFARLVKSYDKEDVPARDVHHLLPGFTATQKAFLDEAVETRDLQAVLDMAGGCERR